MALQPTTLKNGAMNHHTPDDAVYLKPIRLSCHLCNNSGPIKIRHNPWQLRCHFLHHHRDENWQEVDQMLYKLIKMGVLK